MTTSHAPRGAPLAEARARAALRDAGLDPLQPLEPATSTSNQVWLAPGHVVRVSSGLTARLSREAAVAEVLPPELPYPPVVAHGTGVADDWLVAVRMPGRALAHLWPDLQPAQRRQAVHEVGEALVALHQAPVPAALAPLQRPPHLISPDTDPLTWLWSALERAGSLERVDAGLIRDVEGLVQLWGTALDPGPPTTLVHGDLTFENVLHDGDRVTAVFDLEWCRAGPIDLDLDILLRMCAHPDLHVAPSHAARAVASDYRDVPTWLAEARPDLVAAPRLRDRLRTYAVAYEIRALLDDPPGPGAGPVDAASPLGRLSRLAAGRSHLDGALVDALEAHGASARRAHDPHV